MESSQLAELESEISPGYHVRQTFMAFHKSSMKAVAMEPLTKRCELPLFFAAIGQAVRRWKALSLGSLIIQFQQDWPKDKKLQLFKFFTRKL